MQKNDRFSYMFCGWFDDFSLNNWQIYTSYQEDIARFWKLVWTKTKYDKMWSIFCWNKWLERYRYMQLLGINRNSLPVRYLGVPLLSTRLSTKDCQCIMDRITARVKSWTARKLAYGGRLCNTPSHIKKFKWHGLTYKLSLSIQVQFWIYTLG